MTGTLPWDNSERAPTRVSGFPKSEPYPVPSVSCRGGIPIDSGCFEERHFPHYCHFLSSLFTLPGVALNSDPMPLPLELLQTWLSFSILCFLILQDGRSDFSYPGSSVQEEFPSPSFLPFPPPLRVPSLLPPPPSSRRA